MSRLLLALLLLCASATSAARTFTVDDLIAMESYGQVLTSERAGLLLVERRRPYGQAPDYGAGGYFTDRTLGRIMSVGLQDLAKGLRPLFPQEDDAGYWMGSLSPSGLRLSVFRLRARVLSLGIVDLRRGTAEWLDVRPDLPARDPAPAWSGNDRLVVLERADATLPRMLRLGSTALERLAALAHAQGRGQASSTMVSATGSREPRRARLMEIALDGSARRTIAQGDLTDFALSPDGRSVAIVSVGDPVPPPTGLLGVSFASRRYRLRIVSMQDGRTRGSIPEVAPGVLQWSPAGSIMAVARPSGASDWQAAWFATVSPSGAARRLGTSDDVAHAVEPGDALRFQAAWTGGSLIALVRRGSAAPEWRHLDAGGSSSAAIPSGSYLMLHDGAEAILKSGHSLWRVRGRRSKPLPSHLAPLLGTYPDPFSIGDRSSLGPCGAIVLRQLVRGGRCPAQLATDDDEVLGGFRAGLVVRRTDDHGSETIEIMDALGHRTAVDRINAGLEDVTLPIVVRLETPTSNGAGLIHWLLLPRTGPRLPPLVVQPYPGRTFTPSPPIEARPWRNGIGTNALLLVSSGMAVLLPGMPATGRENPSEAVLPQVEAAVDAARRSGRVAAGSYGVMGHSFGGWAAMTIAARAECVSGVVAANGVYDLAAAHATMAGPDRIDLEAGIPFGASAGWAEAGQGAMRATPEQARSRYWAASPIGRAASMRAPVLLVGGDLDPVDLTQSERMFMEIARAGGDAKLLRFWGEGHTVSSPGNIRTYWSSVTSFLFGAARRAGAGEACLKAVRERAGAGRSGVTTMPQAMPRSSPGT